MTTPFTLARRISAADVARREGLHLRRRGAKEWACCPLHGEKTASLCFYEDGRWYCFGCHRHGDAVDLYAALHGISSLEAARTLAGLDAMPRRKLPGRRKRQPFLTTPDDDGFTWDRLCGIRNAAQEIILTELGDTPRLWEAIAARSAAEERLDNLLMGETNEQP